MSLPIFPVSPLPAQTGVTFDWNVNESRYDSGERNAMTPWLRPLYEWAIPFQNMNEIKRETLADFVLSPDIRGGVGNFLMKDAYHFRVNSVLAVRSGYASGSGDVSLYDTRSFFIRADTITIGSLHSTLSGYVTLGAEYSYNQDDGVLTVNTKAQSDVWGVRSAQYYRKCYFMQAYRDQSVIWNIFNADLKIKELP